MTIDRPRQTDTTKDAGARRRHGARLSARRLVEVAGASSALVLALTGCTVHAGVSAGVNRTASPEAVESAVVRALSSVSDETPEVDCGSEAIDIVDGNEIRCDVNTAGYDVVYGSTVTIETENGKDYSVDVVVDDEPKG